MVARLSGASAAGGRVIRYWRASINGAEKRKPPGHLAPGGEAFAAVVGVGIWTISVYHHG